MAAAAAAGARAQPVGGDDGLIAQIHAYINRLTEPPNQQKLGGMKALLLDKETTAIVGMVMSLSEAIGKEFFLIERVDDPRNKDRVYENMQHLKGVIFIRPCQESVDAVISELAHPRFRDVYLFFSNACPSAYLETIARADEYDVIRSVAEYFGDFFAVNPDLMHLNLPRVRNLYQSEQNYQPNERALFSRSLEGVLSMLLAAKRRPSVRYSRSSDLARGLAFATVQRMKEQAELFFFQQERVSPLLLVLDRREDPVTPLLMQWTYQAMVHELIGIQNNRVDLRDVPGVPKDMHEVVLSAATDKFFRQTMYLNYGDLGASVRQLVEEYQRKVKNNQKLATIEDMTRFVENYPQFRAESGNVSKHVAVLGELSRQVDMRGLLDVSESEQTLACHDDHSDALDRVLRLLEDPRLNDDDRLRLVLLYALRYEQTSKEIPRLREILRSKAVGPAAKSRVRAVDAVLQLCGSKMRGNDLFGQQGGVMKKLSSMLGAGVAGVENVYTQHKPLLDQTLDMLAKGKLKTATHPVVEGAEAKYDEVYIFMVGGATYEEALTVANFNRNNGAMRVVLGSTYVHNSRTFLDDLLGSDGSEGGGADFR